jgi:hypothetical protein
MEGKMPAPKTKSNDQEDADYVGRRSQIMRSLRRALDDEDIDAARKAVKRMEDDDTSAKRARRAKKADDEDLDDDEAKRASDDDSDLDDEDLDDDDTADEDDLSPGGAKRGKKARRAKKAKRADDDELDDDEQLDDEETDSESGVWTTPDQGKFERNSRFPIPRVNQSRVDAAKRSALTDNRIVRRAMQLTDRKSWATVKGRYEAMMLAAEEFGYRGPNV